MNLKAVFSLLGFASLAAAAAGSHTSPDSPQGTTITVHLPVKPNPFTLPSTTRATLSSLGKHHVAPLSTLNTFVFHNVTPDSYLLDVHCPTDGFAPLRLDVSPPTAAAAAASGGAFGLEAWETYRGNEWGNKGEVVPVKQGRWGNGVEVRALGGKIYFMDRPGFSLMSILGNPMILMGIVSMGLFIGMPKIMENMDPELKAEFEETQRNGPMGALLGGGGGGGDKQNFDMAAYLAGSKSKASGNGNKANGESGSKQGVRR